MMSALEGGGTPIADESTDKLRECDSDRGGESKIKFIFSADVRCTFPTRKKFGARYSINWMV